MRVGADVEHVGFDDLDAAVAAMRERALRIRAEAPPKTANVLRTYKPSHQVQARLELSGRGLLRKPVAGVDVRGDGTFVPYRGGVRREELDPTRPRHAFRPGARDFGRSEAMTDYMNQAGVPKGSYAAGERVKIPAGAEPPYTVFINGVEQKEGDDFKIEDGELHFTARS